MIRKNSSSTMSTTNKKIKMSKHEQTIKCMEPEPTHGLLVEVAQDTSLHVCADFKQGLWKHYALEVEDIKDALYVGSLRVPGGQVDTNSSYVSFGEYQKHYPALMDVPEYTHKCICGTGIVENCIIYSPGLDRVFTIGSECVKRFTITGRKRSCVTCHKPTRQHTPQCKSCRPPTLCGGCGQNVDGLQAVDTCYRCRYHTPCSYCGQRTKNLRRFGPRAGKCYSCAPDSTGHCTDCDKSCPVKYPRCYTCKTISKCSGCGKGCPQAYPTCWTCSGRSS